MADGCESFVMAGAICSPGAERIHAIRLFHLFSFSARSRRDSLPPARLGKLLGSDDVFGGCVRAWLYHLDILSGAKPVVHVCRHVAQQSHGWAAHGARQLHREMRTGTRRGVPLATRSGGGSGALGSMAAPAVALLDIPSERHLHVRFDCLRAKPLRGGRLRRNGDWDAGICDRRLGDEKARRGRDGSALNRRPAKLRLSTLEDSCNTQQDGLTRDSAHKLYSNWQCGRRGAAGKGDGRHAGEIGWAIVTQQKSASWIVLISDARRFLVDERSLNGDRRIHDGISMRLRESHVELQSELFLNFQGPQIIERGSFGARFQARANVLAVLGGPRRKVSLPRVEEGGLNPGDMIARVFG